MLKITIAFIILTLISCHPHQNNKQKGIKYLPEAKFKNSISIRHKDSIKLKDVFHLTDWNISHNKIITRNLEANNFIRVYSYPEFKWLYNYGKNGKGPEEWIVQNWGRAQNSEQIILYDIMRKSLCIFDTDSIKFKLSATYKLSSEDKLCPPFTQIKQFNDSLFLLKEDEEETYLHLMNLSNKHIYSSYKCKLRKKNKHSYTPFDYIFEILGNNVMLAYCYMNRIEFLKIDESHSLIPFLIIGNDYNYSQIKNYNELPNHFLDICNYEDDFYCLLSKDATEKGNTICVFDCNGTPKKQIILDQNVNKIKFAPDGILLTYKEKEKENIFYLYQLPD